MEVPTAKTLSDIYPEDAVESQTKRWNSLIGKFKEDYGKFPDFISRSPGRVNIIGEHIDYSLYEVIPMAITADVLLAVSVHPQEPGPSTIRLVNVHPQKFESRTFDIPDTGDVHIDSTTLEWTNYFKSGLAGATELLRKNQKDFKQSAGMDIQADGTVPSGGGLSSSAAFVCASALATMKANGVDKVDKKELVEVAITSERAVGVNSGGMDQSASVFPVQGSALYVSFVPELSAQNIAFPEMKSPLVFVIAQSFVAADKHVTGPINYNLRVVEVTLAALVLAKIFRLKNLPNDAGPLGVSLRGFHDTYFQEIEGVENNHKVSKADFEEQCHTLVDKVEQYLPQEEGYTREQLSEILGMSIEDMEQKYMKKFPVRAERFKLRQRAMHVFQEAIRVLRFNELLHSEPPKTDVENADLLKACGALMNETQESCRDLYENSCPELDELCELARGAGSYGSRLTGAGWGGCSVHLVPENKVESVRQRWIDRYYRVKFPDITEERLKEAIVVSKPGSGSCVFELNGRESFMAVERSFLDSNALACRPPEFPESPIFNHKHPVLLCNVTSHQRTQARQLKHLPTMPVETRKMREREKEVHDSNQFTVKVSRLTRCQESKQAPFRLLDLPPELQLRIYEFAVCNDEPIDITVGRQTKQPYMSPRAQPALARTCRSICVDALKFYYAGNMFEANYCQRERQPSAIAIQWLHSIGASSRGLISSLQLYDASLIDDDQESLIGYEDDCLAMMMERFVESPSLGASFAMIRPGLHRVTFPRAQA
ncbi:galactokinase [Elasticomyces elasticus]|nr:galactokinase [Elasticomyces elasticus]